MSGKIIQEKLKIWICCLLHNEDMGCLYVPHTQYRGEIIKGHSHIEYCYQMVPVIGYYSEVSFCSFMHTNARANDGKPYPIQES